MSSRFKAFRKVPGIEKKQEKSKDEKEQILQHSFYDDFKWFYCQWEEA